MLLIVLQRQVVKEARKKLHVKLWRCLNRQRNLGNNIIYVNFLDGAGWIGRQADMREIHRCSDYVLNFNNLNLLEDIVDSYIAEF